jgi:hypothetical protein
VTFPSIHPPVPSTSVPPSSWSTGKEAGITAHFLSLKKPSDVTEDTLALLNVTFHPECDFETLLSSLSNHAQSHLPPKDWLEPPEHTNPLMSSESSVELLSNGKRVPDQKEFYVRAKELTFNNDDAFSTLTRKASRGQAPLRLAHFRKFWEGLDNMAYYWDNSLDKYQAPSPQANDNASETSSDNKGITDRCDQETRNETKPDWVARTSLGPGSPSEEEPRKKAKTEAMSDEKPTQLPDSNGASGGSVSVRPSATLPDRMMSARSAPPKLPWAANLAPHDKPVDLSNGSYQGYRIGNGAEMPDQYRIDCVRGFLEPIAWAFGVTLAQHRRPPVLKLEHVRFPVRMSSVAWQGHKDRINARQGWMEGPVLGIQCRADVNFSATGKADARFVLDAVRELGGLLLLAQERAREGQIERRGGEGCWWTTKERWGGGPGGEVADAEGASDVSTKDATIQAQEGHTQRNVDGSKARRRSTPMEIWKTLKPTQPLWDPKVMYKQIGKNVNVEWDDVRCQTPEISLFC